MRTLLDDAHEFSRRANEWLEAEPRRIATCPIVEAGVVRILSAPGYSATRRAVPGQVAEGLRAITEAVDHAFWPDDVSVLDEQAIDFSRLHGHRQITDAYLSAVRRSAICWRCRRAGRSLSRILTVPLGAAAEFAASALRRKARSVRARQLRGLSLPQFSPEHRVMSGSTRLQSPRTMVLAVSTLLAGPSALAATVSWDGESNQNWSTGVNWSINSVPAAGDTVLISGAGGANQPVLNVASAALAAVNISGGSLTVANVLTAGSVQLSSTGSLIVNVGDAIAGNVTHSGTGSFLNNGTLLGNLSVNGGATGNAGVVTGDITVSGGSFSLLAGTNVADTAQLTLSGGTAEISFADTVGRIRLSGGLLTGTQTLSVTQTYALMGARHDAGTRVDAAGAKTLSGGELAGTLGGAGATTVTGLVDFSGTIVGNVSIAGTGNLLADGGRVTGSVFNVGRLQTTGLAIEGQLNLSNRGGETSRLVASVDGLSVAGTAMLAGELEFDASPLSLVGDTVEIELLRAGSIDGDFAERFVRGPAGYLASVRIDDGSEFDRYLVTFTRQAQVPVPSALLLALAALGLMAGLRRRR